MATDPTAKPVYPPYPATWPEFRVWFADEAAYVAYLERVRETTTSSGHPLYSGSYPLFRISFDCESTAMIVAEFQLTQHDLERISYMQPSHLTFVLLVIQKLIGCLMATSRRI